MPFANLILVLLIGLVLGVIASVALKSRGLVFLINILLGILGGCLGAFAPVILVGALKIDVTEPGYLLRALMGAFALVLVACLFRPAKPRGHM